MGYADPRMLWTKDVGESIGDNTDIAVIVIPANKIVTLYGMRSYAITKSPTADAKIEVVDSSNNIKASVSITQDNGTIADSATSFPVEITAGTSDTIIKLRTDKATGVGCDCHVQVDLSMPQSD